LAPRVSLAGRRVKNCALERGSMRSAEAGF
jgi:hypothetical protein